MQSWEAKFCVKELTLKELCNPFMVKVFPEPVGPNATITASFPSITLKIFKYKFLPVSKSYYILIY